MNIQKYIGFKVLILVTCLLSLCDCFYITLKSPPTAQSTKKCFTTHVFKQERLLIDLQVPVIEKDLEVRVQVNIINKKQSGKKEHKKILTEIVAQSKFKKTVLKQTDHVQSISDDSSLQYETCLMLKSRITVSTQPKVDFEGSFLPAFASNELQKTHSAQNYLFSMTLLTSFSHVIEEKSSPFVPVPNPHKYSKENLKFLQKHSTRLLQLAKQQIIIHRENEKMQAKSQYHAKDLQDSIYSMSITQSAILVFGSLMHINLVKKYLRQNKLI